MGKTQKQLSFTVSVERGAQRFRELIVYIADRSKHDPHFGATKLNKILYHSDFRAFERFGTPLTGFRYFKLPQGPAPKAMIPLRNELQSEGAIKLEPVQRGPHTQMRIVALRDAVLDHFTADEIQLVDEVIDELWPQTASQVSDASHDVRWRVVGDRDDIPYEFAFLSNEAATQKDIQRTRELAERFGWHK